MAVISFPLRLDLYLVRTGEVPSREIAKKLIDGGYVHVNGKKILKPSFLIESQCEVIIEDNEITKYVSRGAFKLEGALDSFGIDVNGFTAVDFGASTGGFTDLLLQRGAACVYAIENGSNQLHPKLLSDSRVISYDNTNARYIEKGFIPLCDIAVMDVSFISQTKLYNSVTNVLKNGGIFISLIKPQYETEGKRIGKNGIIKDQSVYHTVISKITQVASTYGLNIVSVIESPIKGGDGNKEFLAHFTYEEVRQ